MNLSGGPHDIWILGTVTWRRFVFSDSSCDIVSAILHRIIDSLQTDVDYLSCSGRAPECREQIVTMRRIDGCHQVAKRQVAAPVPTLVSMAELIRLSQV